MQRPGGRRNRKLGLVIIPCRVPGTWVGRQHRAPLAKVFAWQFDEPVATGRGNGVKVPAHLELALADGEIQ